MPEQGRSCGDPPITSTGHKVTAAFFASPSVTPLIGVPGIPCLVSPFFSEPETQLGLLLQTKTRSARVLI